MLATGHAVAFAHLTVEHFLAGDPCSDTCSLQSPLGGGTPEGSCAPGRSHVPLVFILAGTPRLSLNLLCMGRTPPLCLARLAAPLLQATDFTSLLSVTMAATPTRRGEAAWLSHSSLDTEPRLDLVLDL